MYLKKSLIFTLILITIACSLTCSFAFDNVSNSNNVVMSIDNASDNESVVLSDSNSISNCNCDLETNETSFNNTNTNISSNNNSVYISSKGLIPIFIPVVVNIDEQPIFTDFNVTSYPCNCDLETNGTSSNNINSTPNNTFSHNFSRVYSNHNFTFTSFISIPTPSHFKRICNLTPCSCNFTLKTDQINETSSNNTNTSSNNILVYNISEVFFDYDFTPFISVPFINNTSKSILDKIIDILRPIKKTDVSPWIMAH